jgi:SAM-dependent methyltransferase
MSDHDPGTNGAADPVPPEARAANLALWNRWAQVHEKSAFYDVEGFKAGGSSLWPLERDELGPYVHEGTSLLHLQCHFGLDTLSWARLGAEVVGLDFSDEAIALARRLAAETGLSDRAEFVCADLYDAGAHLGGRRFDVVFVSWGAIEWLPDLDRWAGIIARHLKPGGTFYMAEMHPFAHTLDDEAPAGVVRVRYPYFAEPGAPAVDAIHGSYADREADTEGLTAYYWPHHFAEVLGALTGAGLRIEHLHEFPFAPAAAMDWMVRGDDRWWRLPDDKGGLRKDLPLSYSLRATRPVGQAAPAHEEG